MRPLNPNHRPNLLPADTHGPGRLERARARVMRRLEKFVANASALPLPGFGAMAFVVVSGSVAYGVALCVASNYFGLPRLHKWPRRFCGSWGFISNIYSGLYSEIGLSASSQYNQRTGEVSRSST